MIAKRNKVEIVDPNLHKIIKRISVLSKERPSHKQILKFLEEIITEQLKIKPRIKIKLPYIDKELVKKKTLEGFPLIDKSDLKLDITSAKTLFKKLCKVLKRNKNVSQEVNKIECAIKDKKLNLNELFRKTVDEDENYINKLDGELDLNKEILSFLVKNSLKPIFELYADKLKDYVDQESWLRSYCPICGSKPVMAELIGAERKKFLVCSCCGYEWRYMRTKCPFCNKANAKALKYFFTEANGKAYRIETCQKCKRYIKTIDSEELGQEIIPAVEDLGTLYLDILAQKEGYIREVYQMGLSLNVIKN